MCDNARSEYSHGVTMDKSTVVVVRLPKPMLDSIDRLAATQFLTRSEALRALLREQIASHGHSSPWPTNGPHNHSPLSSSGDQDPSEDSEAA
jgi:Arc/MetJ-type ribon-helix-helix transcriptional regulator